MEEVFFRIEEKTFSREEFHELFIEIIENSTNLDSIHNYKETFIHLLQVVEKKINSFNEQNNNEEGEERGQLKSSLEILQRDDSPDIDDDKLEIKIDGIETKEEETAQKKSLRPKKKKKRIASSTTTNTGRTRSSTVSESLPPFSRGFSKLNSTTKTRSKNLKPLNEIFTEGYNISLPQKFDSKNETHVKTLENFSSFLKKARKYKESSLSLLRKSSNPFPTSFWVFSFHKYLERFTVGRILLKNEEKKVILVPNEGFEDFLAKNQTSNFMVSLTNYLSIQHESKTEENIVMAVELLDFFKRYVLDPYSTLVGFSPSRKVLSNVNLSPNQDKKFSRGSLILIKSKSKPSSSSNNNNNNNTEEEFYLFCRWANTFHSKIDVFTNISENTTTSVDVADCFELSEELENEIGNCDLKRLDRYIDNPFDEFYRNLMFVDGQESVYNYLRKEKEINVNLIISKSKLLSDSYEFHKSKDILQSIVKSIPTSLLETIQNLVDRKLYEFISRNSPEFFFKPTIVQSYEEILKIPSDAIQATIRRLIGCCDETIDQLKLNKRDLLNGERKKILVQWWLTVIREEIQKFLQSLKFSLDAIPNNYCDQPPSSLDVVKINLAILRTVMNRSNPLYDPTPVITRLKDKIYPEIDNFLLDSKAVLSAEFGCDVRELGIKQLSELFQSKSSSIEDDHLQKWIDGTIKDIEYLTEMKSLEDEEYAKNHPSFHIVPVSGLVMSTLVRFENEHKTVLELWETVESSSSVGTSQIPSSSSNHFNLGRGGSGGAIKESSLNLSKDTPNNNNSNNNNNNNSGNHNNSNNNNSSNNVSNNSNNNNNNSSNGSVGDGVNEVEFQKAVLDGKLKLAENILLTKAKKFDVNRKDSKYGWTALHCAASESHFKLCNKILKIFSSDINVNIPNKDGNTALHYVVRHRANSEKEVDLQSSTIKKLIAKGAQVNLQNYGGETALHAACYRGNYKAALLLLNANANPNFVTKEGHESCLHYAVRSKSTQLVSKLVEAGTDVTAVSILGETPMDIAIKMNSEVLISALRQAALNSYK